MSMRYPAGFISAFYNPLQNPDAPTIGTASAISSGISVAFTAPANVGGSAITGFIATARKTSDGTTVSATGASSPISITGLTEDAFTVTVAAVNTYGPSASSAASNSVTPLPAIGGAFGGGFFAGQISTAGNSIADYNLVAGPVSSAQSLGKQWKTSNTATAGTSSVIDGPTNSSNMNNASHPAAEFCEAVTAGGFSDWYMPAKNELEVCYYNLKPATTSNNTSSGINANAVPARASNYTAGTPAQTLATDFQTGGAETFGGVGPYYWSSTSPSTLYGEVQFFSTGQQLVYGKTSSYRVRAVRRVAV
jgi:hypothetical protein